MKRSLSLMAVFLVSGAAQAAHVVMPAAAEPSPYLLVLAAVALIGTIAHRRNKLKARS